MRALPVERAERSVRGRSASRATAVSIAGLAGLPMSRRLTGLALGVCLLAGLTGLFVATGRGLSLASMLPLYLLAVVIVAVVGGAVVGVAAAVAANLLANWFLTPPYHTFVVDQPDTVVSLVVFGLVALVVSVTVEVASRQRAVAERDRVELQVLSRLAAEPMSNKTLPAILAEIAAAFGLSSTAVADAGQVVAQAGNANGEPPSLREPLVGSVELWAWGPPMFGADLSLLRSMGTAAVRAYEGEGLVERAEEAERLEAVDRARSALLAAVGHDLRTPIASAKAAVSGLLGDDLELSAADRRELLATIESSTDRLDSLVNNLLDMSRLQAGVLTAQPQPVALDAIVARALLPLGGMPVEVDVSDDLPLAWTDPGLLERVVANLVDNALRHGRGNAPVEVAAGRAGPTKLWLHVRDHGAGLPAERWPALSAAFRPSPDSESGGGLGLGLRVVSGLTEAMGATVTPSETPGGGLTMTVTLPVAP